MENYRELLEAFAAKHVQRAFRERFVYEAQRKPAKLRSRICHTINDVFSERDRDGFCPFEADEYCIPICGTGIDCFKEYRWAEVQENATPSFGLLVISPDGSKFFAETEHEYRHPSIPYSTSH